MTAPDATPIWRPLPTKLRAYEAIYLLNRSFEATLLSVERLERLGLFRLEYLNEYKVRLELTRAEANEELIETLHEYEMNESARFDQMQRDWKNQHQDPDDVFIAADQRKREIREQIKELEKGLKRQRRRRTVKRAR